MNKRERRRRELEKEARWIGESYDSGSGGIPTCPNCEKPVTPVNPQRTHYFCEQCNMNIDADRVVWQPPF
jgi:hypothetical protein